MWPESLAGLRGEGARQHEALLCSVPKVVWAEGPGAVFLGPELKTTQQRPLRKMSTYENMGHKAL